MTRAVERMRAALPSVPPAWVALIAAWRQQLGRPGALALLLLGAAAALQWQVKPRLEREALGLEARRAGLANEPVSSASNVAERGPLTAADIPSARQRGRDLELLVATAQQAGLGLERADYSLGAATAGALTRVEATLPLTGSYAGVRRFVADVLNALPHAALESLQLERANAQAKDLQVTARLVLFYSEETP